MTIILLMLISANPAIAADAILDGSLVPTAADREILFFEPFEDTLFASRGWYDALEGTITTEEHIEGEGSTACFECRFLQGTSGCEGGTPGRHLFDETDEIYLSYYVKYSANYVGSDLPYHPHEFLFMTNENGPYAGPAWTYLTAYVEHNEGEPLLSIQDGQNIDESNIGVDLSEITENRAVAGCNGDSDGYGDGECYWCGSTHCNGKQWRAGGVYFQDVPGPYYQNDWHFIEAYFKLNSIVEGIGISDGIIKYWYDDQLIIDHEDITIRTGEHPDIRFNQFLLAPYIGDGSPVEQVMWIDNLTVATSRPGSEAVAESPSGQIAAACQLNQNYPNPFNATTTISFSSNDPQVEITIFNLAGRLIRILRSTDFTNATSYGTVTWDGTDDNGNQVSSGIYLYSLQSAGSVTARKLLMLK